MKRLPLGTKFYTAPQPLTTSERAELENYRNAQQVVPDELANKSFEYIANKFQVSISDAQWILVGWNACRTTMQGKADQVSKDGWVACSELMPENKPGSYEYLVFETLNNGVHHDYWNVPDSGDDCQFTPFWNHYDRHVTHWMPMPAAPQQEAE
ncbi:TPA: DUF551 domain-containing protein [Escherichia coli]|nr:DUF551 domain-containing protein [Escherichia coli]HEI0663021.1 DUF551 domain-containing protein [Escherichia coli]